MISVRCARREDFPLLADLEREVFSLPWSEAAFVSFAEHGGLILAAEEEGVIGHVTAAFAADEGEIMNLAVRTDARRRGAARALLAEAEKAARKTGVKSLFLEVRLSNTAARSLYEKSGFEKVGVRKGFYTRPAEDALLYRKELNV